MRDALNWGVFKGLYKGSGIYWKGKYNIEGSHSEYATMDEARQQIDRDIVAREAHEAAERAEKAASGNYLVCRRDCETVVVDTPDGRLECDLRKFRNTVMWELEEKYDREILWV